MKPVKFRKPESKTQISVQRTLRFPKVIEEEILKELARVGGGKVQVGLRQILDDWYFKQTGKRAG